MTIERKNSFHLLLSDDELNLLRLLAEREGLNASDYLRTMLRRLAGAPQNAMIGLRLRELMGSNADFEKVAERHAATAKRKKAR